MKKSDNRLRIRAWWWAGPLLVLLVLLVWRGPFGVVWLVGAGGLVWLARRAQAPRGALVLFALSVLPILVLLAWDSYTQLTGGYAHQGGHAPIGKSLEAVGNAVLALAAQVGLVVMGLVVWGIGRRRMGSIR